MHRRKGAYSSGASGKKKAAHSNKKGSHQRPAHAAGRAAAAEPTRTYFPTDANAAAQRSGANAHAARSRAASVSAPTAAGGDPFATIRLRSDSTEPHMQQANLVLSAISDLLRERGVDADSGSVNPTHYFGVLMVLLEQRAQQSVESLGAIMYLLSLLLPQLPTAVLKSKMEATASVLIAVLEAHADDAHIAKHVLECSAHLLQATALDVPSLWTNASATPAVTKLLQVLLVYSLDHRPRIRRAGQDGVKDTLKGMFEHSVTAAAAAGSSASGAAATRIGIPKGVCDTMVSFCIREISQCTPKDCQIVLFLCGLLQGCIQYLSVSASAKILEAILSMVGRGNSILMVQAMRTVDAFFMHASEIHMGGGADAAAAAAAHPDSPEAKSRDKFLQLASQLLTVLLTLKPHQNDQLATGAYLNTLKVGLVRFMGGLEGGGSGGGNTAAHSRFASILQTSYEKIPELLSLISEGLLSPKVDVVKGSAKAMAEILRKTLTPAMVGQSVREAEHAASIKRGAASAAPTLPPFYRVIELLEGLLGYRYKVEWSRILLLVAELFHSVGAAGPQQAKAQQLLLPLLRKLDQMHNEAALETPSEDPALDYRPSLDEAIGAAIQALGVETVLTVLPLNLPLDYYGAAAASAKRGGEEALPLHEQLQASRSWLLPLFRSYISSNARLAFYLDFFVPIAASLHDLEKQSNARGKAVEARAFNGLKIGVWDIFPSLCTALPADVADSAKPMLKTLIASNLQVDDLKWNHSAICKGLGGLVRKLKEVSGADAAKADAANKSKSQSKDGGEEEDEDEAIAAFDEDDDEDDDDEEEDSDDEDVVAKAKAQRKAKQAKVKAAAAAGAAAAAKNASAAAAAAASASTSSSGSRRPSAYTAAQASALLSQSLAPLSKHLLPVLFNLAAMPHEKKEPVFEAIAQWSSIADADLLNQSFKKVMRKLLEHTVAMAAKQASKEAGEAAAAEGADMNDAPAPRGANNAAAQDARRAHDLTDIVLSLCAQSCPSLSADNVTFLYGIVKSQLASESVEGGLQKKMYKILACLCEQHPSFFKTHWKELVADLQANSATLQSAALKQRLACVRHVLLHLPEQMLKDKAAIGMLPGFLGEVILGCKEIAHKTRDYAFQVLVELGRKMHSVQEAKRAAGMGATGQELFGGLSQPDSAQPLMAEYIYMIAAGLAGSSNHMQSASVLCLARMLYEFRDVLRGELVGSILTTVLPLFESKSREVIKSLLTFIKVCVLTFDRESLLAHLAPIVGGLVLWCHEKKQRFKLKIKLLFEILMRKVGVDPVRELVPDQHTALIEHIRKSKEREKRQKTEAWKASRKDKGEDDDDAGFSTRPLQDYDSIMRDDELAAEDAASAAAAANGGRAGPKAKASGGVKSGKDVNPLWIRSSDVDFMDPSVVSKVSASNPQQDAAAQASRRGPAFGHGVVQDASSGKLVIAGGAKAPAALSGAAASAMLDIDELDMEIKSKQREKRKRQQQEEDEDDGTEDAPAVKKQQLPGQQFRSAKAGGDMKRRGQLDPYAFVPLDPMAMNKRKKFTAQRRLESIVTAAKQGSQSGSQIAKSRSARSHKNKSHKKHGN